jgi:hypothetical protein
MDRDDLLHALSSASTPHQTSSAMSEARSWLADHPDDDLVREAVQHLARMERERWGLSSSHR